MASVVPFVGLIAFGAASPRIAVVPTQFEGATSGMPEGFFDEAVLSAVQNVTGFEVVGQDDINTLLGFERTKDLLGCDDTGCFAEIGGALGVDKLVAMRVAKLKDQWVVNAKLIDIHESRVESRATDFLPGDAAAVLRRMPAVVDKLFSGGGVDYARSRGPTRSLRAQQSPPEDARLVALKNQSAPTLEIQMQKLTKKLWPKGNAEDGLYLEHVVAEYARRRVVERHLPVDATSDLKARCSAGSAGACEDVAHLRLAGVDRVTWLSSAGKQLMKACELGNDMSCTESKALTTALLSQFKRNATGGTLLAEMCLRGRNEACDELGTGGKAAQVLLLARCEAGEDAACPAAVDAGAVHMVGSGARTAGLVLGVIGFVEMLIVLYIGLIDMDPNWGAYGIAAAVGGGIAATGLGVAWTGWIEQSSFRAKAERIRAEREERNSEKEGVTSSVRLRPLVGCSGAAGATGLALSLTF